MHKAGANSTYAARTVDESVVIQLLNDRDAAKAAKDFTTADSNAAELNNMDICWNDDKKEWYTRVLGSGKSIDGVKTTPTPLPKKKKSSAAVITKKKRKPVGGKNAAANARKKRKNYM